MSEALLTEIRKVLDEMSNLRAENDALRERCSRMEVETSADSFVPSEWALTGLQTRIVGLLLRADGGLVESKTLRAKVWMGRNAPADSQGCLAVSIHRIQRKLAPYGIKIQNVRGHGFFLERKLKPRFDLAAQVKALGADSLLPPASQ